MRDSNTAVVPNDVGRGEVVVMRNRLVDHNRYLQRQLLQHSGDDIIGADFGLRNVMEMIRKVAPMDSPVLLLGETGVGKDVLTNAIHYTSPRCDEPLITVNCGAIPETLIDSELFGHEKGSFTGAVSKKLGHFERADKGTIFLDEVGELPPQAQVRLLRVLENMEFERVGGAKTIKVDVRIIAATNRNLEEMVKEGTFREDLWFRLNVFPITIPPVRERKEDISALVYHFLEKKSKQLKAPGIPELVPGAMDRLTAYDWPGNVREMENVIERAIILNRTGALRFDNIQPDCHFQTEENTSGSSINNELDNFELDTIISSHIKMVLGIADGRISGSGGAAEILNINPSTLRSKIKKLGIQC